MHRSQGFRSAFLKWPSLLQDSSASALALVVLNLLGAAAIAPWRAQIGSKSDSGALLACWVLGNTLVFLGLSLTMHALLRQIQRTRVATQTLHKLGRFMDSTPDAVYGVDSEGLCNFCNRACLRLLGYEEASQLLGSDMHAMVFVGGAGEESGCPVLAAMAQGKSLAVVERPARRSDGTRISVECRSSLVHDGTRIIGAAVTLLDVTVSKAAKGALKRDRETLETQLHDLSRHSKEVALFGELAEMLQASLNTQELCRIVSAFAQELFPAAQGALFILNEAGGSMEPHALWGRPQAKESAGFPLEDCWSIRRGKPHYRENPREDLYCAHLSGVPPAFSLCLPLMGQGITLGMLHLWAGVPGERMTELRQSVAAALAYQVALGLSNLRLKEILREEAIRDPVTGLYNRRFMQESLEHEVQRALRAGTQVGVAALDLDHFKEANDTLGHAAGDTLLLGLSRLLKGSFRSEDICCRQGGDEFLVVLPDISPGGALDRVEALRKGFEQFTADQFPALTGKVTLSAGLSMYPQDATTPEGLQKTADRALYRAKALGRNRVEVAHSASLDAPELKVPAAAQARE